jgi:hypothetical protein
MKIMLKKIFGSNRLWHLGLMIIPALLTCCWCNSWLSGLLITLAVACSLEFKDVLWTSKCSFSLLNINKLNWKNFDLLDVLFTLIGGFIAILIYFWMI